MCCFPLPRSSLQIGRKQGYGKRSWSSYYVLCMYASSPTSGTPTNYLPRPLCSASRASKSRTLKEWLRVSWWGRHEKCECCFSIFQVLPVLTFTTPCIPSRAFFGHAGASSPAFWVAFGSGKHNHLTLSLWQESIEGWTHWSLYSSRCKNLFTSPLF